MQIFAASKTFSSAQFSVALILAFLLFTKTIFSSQGIQASYGEDNSVNKKNNDASLAVVRPLRILFAAFVDSGSHIGSMVPLIKRLAEHGHRVSVLETATRPKARDLGPNVTMHFIQVPQNGGIARAASAAMFRKVLGPETLPSLWDFCNQKFVDFLREHPNIFKQLTEECFDVVIIDELFGIHSYALAAYHRQFKNTPFIIYATTTMVQGSMWTMALGRNWVSEPYLMPHPSRSQHDAYDPTIFGERLENAWKAAVDVFSVNFIAQGKYLTNVGLLGARGFSFHWFFSEASAVFGEYLDKGKFALTTGHEIFNIGPSCARPRPLPSDLERFVSDPSSSGTIFIAFGTNVLWDVAPDHVLDAFFGAIERLSDYRVVFSYNGPEPEQKPGGHVLLTKWAPQFDLLGHPRTRLFVSHGGLKSFKETLCAQLPAVYMPVYAEQAYNAKMALRFGYATAVNKFSVSEAELLGAINEILANYTVYKGNAERAHRLIVDRPMGDDSLELARWEVERTARATHSGLERFRRAHFRRRGQDLRTSTYLFAEYLIGIAAFVWLLSSGACSEGRRSFSVDKNAKLREISETNKIHDGEPVEHINSTKETNGKMTNGLMVNGG